MNIEELAIKNGAVDAYSISDDVSEQLVAFKSKAQLQAFADEYAKLMSIGPVGELRCDATTGHTYSVFWYERSAPPINSKIYLANPINTQLQTERDELEKRATIYAVEMNTQAVRLGDAIAYIKKLEEALLASNKILHNEGIYSGQVGLNLEVLASRPASLLGDE